MHFEGRLSHECTWPTGMKQLWGGTSGILHYLNTQANAIAEGGVL